MTFARFGKGKFGEFQFGSETDIQDRFALEIDWDGDGLFDGHNDALAMSSLNWERGKRYIVSASGEGFETDTVGRLNCVLQDPNAVYDPFSNPNANVGRLFRLWVQSPSGLRYDLMSGKTGVPTTRIGRGIRRIQLSGEDGWGTLRDQKSLIDIPLQSTLRCDVSMNLVLDKIGWPTVWGRDLQHGVDAHPNWYAAGISASSALYDLAFSELGRLWLAGDGSLTFRNRHFTEVSAFTITDADVFLGSLQIIEPWDSIRNSIRVSTTIRTQTFGVMWQSSSPIRLVAGESFERIIDFTYGDPLAAVVSVTQPVSGVDYFANTADDGTGLDLTADFSVSVDQFASSGRLLVTNNGLTAGYVTVPLVVRGTRLLGVTEADGGTADDTASIALFNVRTLRVDYPWVDNTNYASYFARRLRSQYAPTQKHLAFAMKTTPDKQFALDLGTQVDVNLTTVGITGTYRVYYVRGQWTNAAGSNTLLEVQLEPVTTPAANLWTVPHTIPMVVA